MSRRYAGGPWGALAAPGVAWLGAMFLVPLYAVACVAFGRIDPIFRDALPEWNPLAWRFDEAGAVLSSLASGPLRAVALRTVAYVAVAMLLALAIGFPIAYYLARHAGRWRLVLLALIVVPYWVNYLMRMMAWYNLLSPSGLGARLLRAVGLERNWMDGSSVAVVLGLVYGYVPFIILPLYATLERLDWRLVEAARDLGAGPRQAFRLVTLPLARAGTAAACVLIALPMFGDYYTNDLLSRSPRTEMLGNQIDFYLNASTQPQRGAVLVLLLSVLLLAGLSSYLRSTDRTARERTR